MSRDRDGKSPYSYEGRLLFGEDPHRQGDLSRAVVPPLSPSTNYRFASVEEGAEAFRAFARRTEGEDPGEAAWVYDRWDEPNTHLLEERLAMAASARHALAFGTGMAAVGAVASVALRPGDGAVLQRPLYGGTEELFTRHVAGRLGVEVRFVEELHPEAFAGALTGKTRLVWLETPANPNLAVVDIEETCRAVREAAPGPPPLVAVDNTFAGPWCQRPLEQGADLVVESLTKFVSGFGTVMGGMVAAGPGREELMGALLRYRADAGGSLSPWASWHLLVYGLPTLALRLGRQQETAARLAEHLQGRDGLDVSYPGLPSHPGHEAARRQMRDPSGRFAPGAMLYFRLRGKDEAGRARRFLDHLAGRPGAITLAASLGQVRTLVEQPTLMSHSEAAGATPTHPGGVRMSVGIEPFDDLRLDLDGALEASL